MSKTTTLLSIVAAAMVAGCQLTLSHDDSVPMRGGAPNSDAMGWVTKTETVALDSETLMSMMGAMVQVSEPVIRSSDGQTARVVNVHASFGVGRVILSERSISTSRLVDDDDPITFVHSKPEAAMASYHAGKILGVHVEVPRDEPELEEFLISIGPTRGTWGQVASSSDLEVVVLPNR